MQIENREGKQYINGVDVSSWSEEDKMDYLAALTSIEEEKQELAEVQELVESPKHKIAIAREEAAKLADESAAAKRKAEGDLVWADVLKKYDRKKIARIDSKMGIVVVRCPTEEELQSYLNAQDLSGPERKGFEEEMAKSLVVHPSRAEIEKMMKELPTLRGTIASAASRLADATEDEKRPTG